MACRWDGLPSCLHDSHVHQAAPSRRPEVKDLNFGVRLEVVDQIPLLMRDGVFVGSAKDAILLRCTPAGLIHPEPLWVQLKQRAVLFASTDEVLVAVPAHLDRNPAPLCSFGISASRQLSHFTRPAPW